MHLPVSIRLFTLACFVSCLLLWSGVAGAQDDDIQLIPTPAAGAPAASNEIEIRGMHCTPDVKEVEIRRPIPVSCTVDYAVAGVELRYKIDGPGKGWEKIELTQGDTGYTGSIPCGATSKPGRLKLYLFARNDDNKVIARVGRHETPLVVRLVEHSKAAPPALPGQQPPARCFEPNECPPELVGTPACPGTHAVKNAKKGWGGSCEKTDECQSGMECIKGSCETPAKCDDAKDCPEGGECTDGVCHVPDAEELKSRMGPPKHHWFGIHAGPDFLVMSEGTGVCGSTTSDSKDFDCFEGGNVYNGVPNTLFSGHVKSGFYLATVRALASYEYMFGRVAVGARVGWVLLRGAPKGFSPFHLEARALYSLRKEPFKMSFRPYLGLTVGHAQVAAAAPVIIVDCTADTTGGCRNAPANELAPYGMNGTASQKQFNAYRHGSSFFFGPSLMMMFALANDAAIVFNLTTMLPNLTFEPTLGYQMGL